MNRLMNVVVSVVLCAGICRAEREVVKLASVPTLSPNGKTLVFEYHRDLWIASSDGGEARPLTTHPAQDTWPVFSPDGEWIAFGSNRDDSWQTYIMPVSGGSPRQLTFHSEGSTPRAWFPDGKSLVVRSQRAHKGLRDSRLFRVDVEGGTEARMLFNAYASEVSVSPDGERLLFTTGGERTYRKGYEGSLAAKVWSRDLAIGKNERVLDLETSCRSPLWKPDGKGFYYVGRQGGSYNVREHTLKTGEDVALTTFADDSVILPALSANGKRMVFRNLFDFYSMDPRRPKSLKKLELWIDTDEPEATTRRRWYTKAWNNEDWGTLSTTDDGLELCFTAGGDLWVMDTVLREPVRVCGETATHEREAVFADEGQVIYFLRDDGLGVNIWKAERENEALFWWENQAFKLTPVTRDQITRARLSISPDGSRLAVGEGAGELWTMNLDGSERRQVVESSFFDVYYDWAPDGKWLACNMSDSWGNRDIWIVSESGQCEPYNVSRHPDWDGSPCWSPDGKVIAFTGRRFDDTIHLNYVRLSHADEINNKRRRTRDEARETLEKARKKKKADEKDKEDNGDEEEDSAVRIDFEGLANRIHSVEIDGAPKALFWSHDSKSLAFQAKIDGKDGTWKVRFPDPEKPEFMTKIKGRDARWLKEGGKILWLTDGVPAAYTKKYPFKLYNEVDIPAYRRLAFRIMWRELRDRFYDPAMNNRDWDAIRLKYEDQAASSDWDSFGRVAELLLGELNASHMGYEKTDTAKKEWSPDYKSRQGWSQRTAALGLEFDRNHDGAGLKIEHVVRDSAADRQEAPARQGEILLAIDGQKIDPGKPLAPLLTGRNERDIQLTLLGTNGVERVIVVDEEGYSTLRGTVRKEWMEHNREMVERLSEGRFGYLNIEKMNHASLRQFQQEIYAEGFGKDGLVIDVRNNAGGLISDHLISILCHPRHAVTVPRGGKSSYQQGYLPTTAWFKPIVVLCNEYSASNSEIFCHAIQTLRRGRIVGVPTQRSVISTNKKTVLDVGSIRVTHRGWFRLPDGRDMEMQPCVPDVIITNDPEDVPTGRDPQLERAVQELLIDVESGTGSSFPVPHYASEER